MASPPAEEGREAPVAQRAAPRRRRTTPVRPAVSSQGADSSHLDSQDVMRARQQLALAYQTCARFNFNEGVCNHLSWQLEGRDEFLLVRYGLHWSQVTAADILVVDLDGRVLRGTGLPEITGFFSHRALHKALGDGARAVLHAHMPFATSLMALKPDCGGQLLPIHQGYMRFHGWTAYEDLWGGFFDADVSDATTAIAVQWRERNGGRCPRLMLSRNHGVFAFGDSLAEAWDNLYYCERLCELQVRALSCAGGDLSRLQLIPEAAIVAGAQQEAGLRLTAVHGHWKSMETLLGGGSPRFDSGV